MNETYTLKEVIIILKDNGFEFVCINGSHHVFLNRISGKRTVVPMQIKDLKKGTLHGILKQTGIDLK